jgi:uncharacterized protein YunC (DUF1805 family)
MIKLQAKRLIVLCGRHGYVMCGYLNLKAAQKFKDVAIKIVGVGSIKEALKAQVHSCTSYARKLGIQKGDSIEDTLKLIA